jgi:pilus assembly protein CpaB
MNKKAVIILGLALVFGAISAVLVSRVLKGQAELSAMGKAENIVVAASSISIGQRITPDQVRLEEWPKRILPDGVVKDLTQVVDRVSLDEVAIGEPILKSRLASEGSAAGLSAVIPPGMRAMTVKVDEVIGVAGFVSPSTYVDVVATAMRSGLEESASRVVLQHVKVLASGKQVENKDGGPVEVKTVTLLVTLDQAEVLALASHAGKLQLVMRNSVDEEEVPTTGVNTAALFGGQMRNRLAPTEPQSKPVAKSKPTLAKTGPVKETPPPPKPVTVELLRGVERTSVTFQ